MKFKIPVDILKEGRAEIESFPYAPGERSWDGRALIIKGKKSKCVSAMHKNIRHWEPDCLDRYINRHNIPLIDQFFPQNQLKELDTGHWGKYNQIIYCECPRLSFWFCPVHAEL